jgi:hypothetical protein
MYLLVVTVGPRRDLRISITIAPRSWAALMEPLVGPPSSSNRYSKDRNRLEDCLRRAGCERRYHSLAEKSTTVGLATGPLLFHRQYTAFPLPNMCGRFDHQSRLWPRVCRRKDPLIPVNDRFKVYSGMPYRKKVYLLLTPFRFAAMVTE